MPLRMNKPIQNAILAAVLLAAVSASAAPDPATQSLFTNLMEATVSDHYDDFIALCDARMKSALTKPMLEEVSAQIKPHATQGYDSEYLGELNQRGYQVYLWRLKFKDGSDDILATMSLKEGRVGGFYLH